MIILLFYLIFISTNNLFCNSHDFVYQEPQQQTIEWFKKNIKTSEQNIEEEFFKNIDIQKRTAKQLQEELTKFQNENPSLKANEKNNKAGKGKCFVQDSLDFGERPNIEVYISFSVPSYTWIVLSQELEKVNGVFVLKGLPKNSFNELAKTIFNLRKIGVRVPIQVNPKSFRDLNIERVPTFVLRDGDRYDKVTGNVSVKHILELFKQKGDTKIAANLLRRLDA